MFGSTADLIVDINLIAQYLTLILLFIGYIKRRPYKTHGYLMMTVTLIAVVTTILIMAPRLIPVANATGPTIVVHAIVGLVSIFLGAYFNFKFVIAMRSNQPLTCGTKNIMRLTFLIWLSPIIGGTFFYISNYFPV